jgi:hypothetical protein
MSKSMKLAKSYLLKSQNAMKLSPLHFQLSIFVKEKRLTDSATHLLAESTGRVRELANMTILGYSCGVQLSHYTKNHCFTFKALIFCIESLSIKKRCMR